MAVQIHLSLIKRQYFYDMSTLTCMNQQLCLQVIFSDNLPRDKQNISVFPYP